MAEFQYQVITPDGKEKRGTMEGRSAEQVTLVLKSQKNIVMSVNEASIMTKDINISFGQQVKARDFSVFCRQFVSIINAGVSIIDALDMMVEQTENKALKKALKGILEDVSKGESMSLAMKKRSKIFPAMLCNMVEAGEASGSMEVAFERMAVQFEKEAKLKASIKKAMTYPIIVLVVMIAVLFLMMIWVIPSFMGMFAELDTEMPAITQAVVNLSDFVIAKWWLILLVAIVIFAAFRLYKSTPNGKMVLGGIVLKIPVFGNLQIKSECARLARTMCTLLGAGVPMIEALGITARSMENVHYKKALADAKEQVTRGVPLSRPLKVSGLFPPMVVHMITIGEETGNIESMLENLAEYYEEDVQNATEQVMSLIEPLIIIIMGVMVGFLILAIMQPMLTLYDSIS